MNEEARAESTCRKCHELLGWYCSYCLKCWGNLPEDKKATAQLHREFNRDLRSLKRKVI